MEDRGIDEIIKTGEKTENELLIEKLTQQSREKYFKEHGKWPEEDGICIHINL